MFEDDIAHVDLVKDFFGEDQIFRMGILMDGSCHANGKILGSILSKLTMDQDNFVIVLGLIVRYFVEKLKRSSAGMAGLFKGDDMLLIGAENVLGKRLTRLL
ncbi:MAG: hypothetical protein R2877_02165 [Bdellovibrionota bacterium]